MVTFLSSLDSKSFLICAEPCLRDMSKNDVLTILNVLNGNQGNRNGMGRGLLKRNIKSLEEEQHVFSEGVL